MGATLYSFPKVLLVCEGTLAQCRAVIGYSCKHCLSICSSLSLKTWFSVSLLWAQLPSGLSDFITYHLQFVSACVSVPQLADYTEQTCSLREGGEAACRNRRAFGCPMDLGVGIASQAQSPGCLFFKWVHGPQPWRFRGVNL